MQRLNLLGTNFYSDKLHYDGKEKLIHNIVSKYNDNPSLKPDNWEENVFTTFQSHETKTNIEYFELAGMPLDLVAAINYKVQQLINLENLNELGTFYISEMWCNAYKNGQYQHMHKHGNKNDTFFAGVYYASFDSAEHSPTRFYNPSFDVNFDKVKDHEMFISQPTVEEDDILIFPSQIGHDVLAQRTEKLRITVSFNVRCAFDKHFYT